MMNINTRLQAYITVRDTLLSSNAPFINACNVWLEEPKQESAVVRSLTEEHLLSNSEQMSHCVCECCTYDDRLPLEVDVVDAHHLVGRKSSDTTKQLAFHLWM